MHASLRNLDHRPWPIPRTGWTWRQSWLDLLFAHWPIDASSLRPLIPREVTLQEFDGSAWIGVVPFRMSGVMRRPFPDLPWVSAFPELNVRTYVELDGKPGVWFLSLDATNPLAVWAARRFFHLPYFRAAITLRRDGEEIRYESRRGEAAFTGTYAPTSPVRLRAKGSLEHWLTERYCLYARDPRGRVLRNDVHHAPWPLQDARADIRSNSMLAPHGLRLPDTAPLLHFAESVDVVVWNAEVVRG